jgi:hypothetical protein
VLRLTVMSSSWTRRAPAVVHKDAGGVALSTPDGIVSLSPVEARQLALDLTMASGLAKPRPGPTWFGVVLVGRSPLIFTALALGAGAAGYGIALLLGWA